MITIKLLDGTSRQIKLLHFEAMNGWEIENKLLNFAASDDSEYRKQYTMRVLTYAKVVIGENELPLATPDLIDNHLQSWQNVKQVFEEVLRFNGIEPKTHIVQFHDWDMVGAKIGAAMTTYIAKVYEQAGGAINTEG